ncbi:MAG: hypothetical protein U0800_24170 [Isosphaeraceae bacterium]
MANDHPSGGLDPSVRPGWTFRPLEIALALIALGMLACWVPHYRTWPLYADHDVFVTAAQSWDLGLRPYRDYACNNLPGTIFVAWILGKLFGWGNPRRSSPPTPSW